MGPVTGRRLVALSAVLVLGGLAGLIVEAAVRPPWFRG